MLGSDVRQYSSTTMPLEHSQLLPGGLGATCAQCERERDRREAKKLGRERRVALAGHSLLLIAHGGAPM